MNLGNKIEPQEELNSFSLVYSAFLHNPLLYPEGLLPHQTTKVERLLYKTACKH